MKNLNIDYHFWFKKNPYYSDTELTKEVLTGLKHAKKAGLINRLVGNLKSSEDLVLLIKKKIKEKNNPDEYFDNDLLIIFDLIQGWGGPTGMRPYVKPKASPSRMLKERLYADTYRIAVEMLYRIDKEDYEYDPNIKTIKDKIEEMPFVGESFSTKHLSFWSRNLANCPDLIIFDKKLKNIFSACNEGSEIGYKEFLESFSAEFEPDNAHGLDTFEKEAAIFAFSKNYFENEELVLYKDERFQIKHKDEEIARELVSNQNY